MDPNGRVDNPTTENVVELVIGQATEGSRVAKPTAMNLIQHEAIYKFLQNKQKKDSSFLYKKNSHVVRNCILPSA